MPNGRDLSATLAKQSHLAQMTDASLWMCVVPFCRVKIVSVMYYRKKLMGSVILIF